MDAIFLSFFSFPLRYIVVGHIHDQKAVCKAIKTAELSDLLSVWDMIVYVKNNRYQAGAFEFNPYARRYNFQVSAVMVFPEFNLRQQFSCVHFWMLKQTSHLCSIGFGKHCDCVWNILSFCLLCNFIIRFCLRISYCEKLIGAYNIINRYLCLVCF